MNKRGADKILSVYWFVILTIVAVGVVAMVWLYYGSPYDVREMEANIMINRVADCLSKAGIFNEDAFNGDFLSNCHLNFETADVQGEEQTQYYLEVSVEELDVVTLVKNPRNDLKVEVGNPNLGIFCDLEDKNQPTCVERNLYSVDSSNTGYIIKVLSVVDKNEQNV